MVVIVAAVLSTASILLRPFQERNIETAKRTDILMSVDKAQEIRQAENRFEYIEEEYERYITESYVINHRGNIQEGVDAFEVNMREEMRKPAEERNLPIFVCTHDDGSNSYIIPMHGRGLWGPVFGYIALEEDFNTIYGIILDHESETPGLGAEIAGESFQEQFRGKRIFDEDMEFVSIKVIRPADPPIEGHSVDGISGGTITSQGVEEMLYDVLINYVDYFKERKKD